MNVEVILENGVLQPLGLSHARTTGQVPDDKVEAQTQYDLPPEVYERARTLRERLDAIRDAPLPPDDQLPELTEKQLERIAAFELRDER